MRILSEEEILERKQLADECIAEVHQCLNQGRLKEAETIAARARDLYEEINDKHHMAVACNLLSVTCDEMGNDTLALEYLLDALDIVEEEEFFGTMSKIYMNLGSKLKGIQAYDKALYYFNLARDTFEKAHTLGMNHPEEENDFSLILHMNLATIYCKIGDIEKTRFHYEAAKEYTFAIQNPAFRFTFQSFEALMLWHIGRKEEIVSRIESIIEEVQKTAYATDYLESLGTLLELLEAMGDYEHWERVLKIMEAHLVDNVGINIVLELQSRWLDFYKKSGNMKKYQESCIRFYELSREKRLYDFKNTADMIDLKKEIRLAARQKEYTDKIIYQDPLTQIGNRSKLQQDIKTCIEEATKKHRYITIGLIDVDNFKECNDTYGHIQGDTCLKNISVILQEKTGELGMLYRYGGDEFLLLLPDAEESDIRQLGQNIQDGIREAKLPGGCPERSPFVTVSQGYATVSVKEEDTLESLIDLADQALYAVKRNGRNGFHLKKEL